MKFNHKISKSLILIVTLATMLISGGCARYARDVNELYIPSLTIHGKGGEINIVIPENQQTKMPNIKWALGSVTDPDNVKIDEIYSPRSGYELVQSALALELKQAGYNVFEPAVKPAAAANLLYLSKVEIVLDQVSSLYDINASAKLNMEIDLFRNGQFQRKLRYDLSASKIDIKDRGQVVRSLLKEILQSAMKYAVPDLVASLEK